MQYKIFYSLCLFVCFFKIVSANAFKPQKEIQMNDENHTPEYLYKIVSLEDWQQSLMKNEVVNSPLDEKFIHLATKEQLPHIAQKFWHGKNYMILKLDVKKIKGNLIYETNPGGTTKYYHLYKGIIPLDAVLEK